ncbi:hypothetical protein QO209_31100 [Pseudomonas citronellolis]|uniref:hypothetical protein n=1 Tax=Pseudomonas citronellolis TaxID=53408 RepID=UPI0026487052|nr:hypothetical protein [Pseudomonas citronellolis]MDN6876914.1 hypothetical protein [Pseudomonas citronellolis]
MDTNKLKELAERAHKLGRWYWNPTVDAYPDMAVDQDFMLAANPQVILGLIERLERAEKDAARYRELRKLSPHRFRKLQDAATTDGGDVFYFHADRFDAGLDAALEGGGR